MRRERPREEVSGQDELDHAMRPVFWGCAGVVLLVVVVLGYFIVRAIR